MKETDRQMKETDRKLKALGQQLGGIGEKFGSFTEGFAANSIARVLKEEFGMTTVVSRQRTRRNGDEQELDMFGYTNDSQNEAVVVEIKSKLRTRDIEQMQNKMAGVKGFLPEHADKKIYGMICYVDGDADTKKAIIKNGWYLANVADEIFRLESIGDFSPRVY